MSTIAKKVGDPKTEDDVFFAQLAIPSLIFGSKPINISLTFYLKCVYSCSFLKPKPRSL